MRKEEMTFEDSYNEKYWNIQKNYDVAKAVFGLIYKDFLNSEGGKEYLKAKKKWEETEAHKLNKYEHASEDQNIFDDWIKVRECIHGSDSYKEFLTKAAMVKYILDTRGEVLIPDFWMEEVEKGVNEDGLCT
jgi:hypothetical protein